MKFFWALIFIGYLMSGSAFCLHRTHSLLPQRYVQIGKKLIASAEASSFKNVKNNENLKISNFKDKKFENEHDDYFFWHACAGYFGAFVFWLTWPRCNCLNRPSSRLIK